MTALETIGVCLVMALDSVIVFGVIGMVRKARRSHVLEKGDLRWLEGRRP